MLTWTQGLFLKDRKQTDDLFFGTVQMSKKKPVGGYIITTHGISLSLAVSSTFLVWGALHTLSCSGSSPRNSWSGSRYIELKQPRMPDMWPRAGFHVPLSSWCVMIASTGTSSSSNLSLLMLLPTIPRGQRHCCAIVSLETRILPGFWVLFWFFTMFL